MFNYINSWKSRKSSQWNIEVRLGKITFLHLNYNKTKFRFMVLNLGFDFELISLILKDQFSNLSDLYSF